MKKALVILVAIILLFGCESKEVIIIGGGVSGVTAGNALKKQGFNVTVLEARDRRGGRLWTDNSTFGYMIDFGGAWIHGKKNNNVYSYAANQNTTLYSFNFDDAAYYSSTITNLSDPYDKYYDTGDKFIKYINKVRNTYKGDEDHPLSDLYKSYVKTTRLSRDEKCYLDNYIYVELEDDYGTKIENLSAVYMMIPMKEMDLTIFYLMDTGISLIL